MAKEVRTFCRICEPACGLIADVDGGKVTLKPDRAHPVHKGFCCHKGLSFGHVNADPDRLLTPIRRVNGRNETRGNFERVSWDGALEDIGARLRDLIARFGPDSIATYYGNPLAFDSRGFAANAGFAAKLGTKKTFSGATQDCANKIAGSEEVYGTGSMHPIPDLEHTDYFLCIGSNPRVSHMSFIHTTDPMQLIKSIRARGGTVRYVNPRRIESSSGDGSDLLQIKPDTDTYFLAGLLSTIDAMYGLEKRLPADRVKNIAGLAEFVRQFPAERVADVTGIEAPLIRSIAADIYNAPSAAIYMSTGVNMGRQGTLAYWLVQMLSLVTGNLGKRGGNLYSGGFFPQAALGATGGRDPFFQTSLGSVRHCAGVLPGALFTDCLADQKSPTKALLVFSGNPLLTMGGEERARELLRSLDLIVCVDIYRNATGEIADYVLPAADWLEREDINVLGAGYQTHPYVQYTEAVVPPAGERRADWWIYAALEKAAGLPSLLDDGNASSWYQIDAMLEAAGLSVEGIKSAPHSCVVLPPPDPNHVFEIGIQHADDKIDCCPSAFEPALARAQKIFKDLQSEPAETLKLITRRTPYMHNSWLHNVEWLKRPSHHTNPLYLHPDDGSARGLADGDNVRVSNAYGFVTASVRLDDTLLPGVVAMTHGWGNEKTAGMRVAQTYSGVNVNRLMPIGPGTYEPLSNQSFMTGIPVHIEKAS